MKKDPKRLILKDMWLTDNTLEVYKTDGLNEFVFQAHSGDPKIERLISSISPSALTRANARKLAHWILKRLGGKRSA